MSQGSNFPYCNVGKDLQIAYSKIEHYRDAELLEDWTVASGQTNTYQKESTGYVSVVYEDDEELTVQTSIADTESNAGSFYYDDTNDILYVHTTGSADPDTVTIEASTDDWNDLKTTMRNKAMEEVESLLDPEFPRPLPFSRTSYEGYKYDEDIVHATALLTCAKIIEMQDPSDPVSQRLRERVWNPGEDVGILWEHRQGQRSFSFETTSDDFGGRLENLTLDSTSTGRLYTRGIAETDDHWKFRIKISTGGAVETAEYTISDDDGRTYGDANTTYNQFQHLAFGIYIRFDGTFVADDEWLLEIASEEERVHSNLSTIQLRR